MIRAERWGLPAWETTTSAECTVVALWRQTSTVPSTHSSNSGYFCSAPLAEEIVAGSWR